MAKKFNIDGIKRLLTTDKAFTSEEKARERFWSPTNLPSEEKDYKKSNYLSDENKAKAPRKIYKEDLTLPRSPTQISRATSSTVSSLILNDIIMSLKYNALKGGIYIIANNPEKAEIILESMSGRMDIYKIDPLDANFRKSFDQMLLLQNKDNMKNSIIFLNAVSHPEDDLKWLISSINANRRHIIDKGMHLLIWVTDEQIAEIQSQTDKSTESIIKFYRFRTRPEVQTDIPAKTDDETSFADTEHILPAPEDLEATPVTEDVIADVKTIIPEGAATERPTDSPKNNFTFFKNFIAWLIAVFKQFSTKLIPVIKQFMSWLMPIVKQFIMRVISLLKRFMTWLLTIVIKKSKTILDYLNRQ